MDVRWPVVVGEHLDGVSPDFDHLWHRDIITQVFRFCKRDDVVYYRYGTCEIRCAKLKRAVTWKAVE